MIKTLGKRVERGDSQDLRDSQRIEDRSSGFDINASSNGVPKLGGTVDFETLVVGPAMTSLSRLGASTTTCVHGLAKSTSWEDDVWGSVMAGSDVSVSLTQRTLTDASTSQLQVSSSPPPGSVRSSLSFPVTTTHSLLGTPKPQRAPLRPVGSTSLNTHHCHDKQHPSPIRYILLNPPSQNERLRSRTITHTWTFPDPTAYAFGVTPTPQLQPMSTGAALPYTKSTTVDLETKL